MTTFETGKAPQAGETAKITWCWGVAEVPYDHNADLPRPVRDHLPERAQTIYREAFNHAWVQYGDDPAHEQIAHRVAWSAVKRKYLKAGDRWVAKKLTMTVSHHGNT